MANRCWMRCVRRMSSPSRPGCRSGVRSPSFVGERTERAPTFRLLLLLVFFLFLSFCLCMYLCVLRLFDLYRLVFTFLCAVVSCAALIACLRPLATMLLSACSARARLHVLFSSPIAKLDGFVYASRLSRRPSHLRLRPLGARRALAP